MTTTFLKNHRPHLIILIILIGIALGCNWYLKYDSPPMTNPPQADTTTTLQTPNEMVDEEKQYSNIAISNEQLTKPQNDNTYNETNNDTATETVFIQVNDKNYDLPYSPSTTVYEAMQRLTADSRQPFLFSAKEFSGMGYFVEEINGLKNNNQTGEYWIYYLNGQSATMGISQLILKPGDKIEWKYEKAKF